MPNCPNCGNETDQTDNFCSKCGNILYKGQQNKSPSNGAQGVEEQRTGYLDTLDSIYQSLRPPVSSVAKLENGTPPNLDILFEAYSNYQPALQSVKAMRKAPYKDLNNIRKALERTLSMAIKAGEMVIKTVDDHQHNAKMAERMHFSSLVAYVSYVEAYHDEFIKKMSIMRKL